MTELTTSLLLGSNEMPTIINRSAPDVVWEMVSVSAAVVSSVSLSTTGGEPPEGLMGTAPMTHGREVPITHDMVVVEVPGFVLAAPLC